MSQDEARTLEVIAEFQLSSAEEKIFRDLLNTDEGLFEMKFDVAPERVQLALNEFLGDQGEN